MSAGAVVAGENFLGFPPATQRTQLFSLPGTHRHVSSRSRRQHACAQRKAEHAQRPASYIRGSGGGAAAARESRGPFLSVSGRLGAGDCWRGAWKLALVPLRLLSRSRPLGSSLTPGELSVPPRCRPISRGRKMPSSAPTVSKAASRAAQGRPEAWEFEGPLLLPAPGLWRPVVTAAATRPCLTRPPYSSGPRRKARIRNRRSRVCSLAAAQGLRRRATARGSDLSDLAILSHDRPPAGLSDRGLLGKPRAPCRHLGVPGGGNMAPSRGQCTREPRLHLPPGSGARLVYLHPTSPARLAPDPTRRPSGSGSTCLTTSLHFRPLLH